MRTCLSDQAPDGFALVTVEIVHDDHVAWLEGWNKNLFDIGLETQPVDRAIKDEWRGYAIATQRREEGERLPMTMWQLGMERLAFAMPAADARHVGLHPGFIDEHQAAGLDPGLVFGPPVAPSGDVRPVPLGRVNCFF